MRGRRGWVCANKKTQKEEPTMKVLSIHPLSGDPYEVVIPRNTQDVDAWVKANLVGVDHFVSGPLNKGVAVNFVVNQSDAWGNIVSNTLHLLATGEDASHKGLRDSFRRAAWSFLLSEQGVETLVQADGDCNWGDILLDIPTADLERFGLYPVGSFLCEEISEVANISLCHDEFPYPDDGEVKAELVVEHGDGTQEVLVPDDLDVDIREGTLDFDEAAVSFVPTDKVYVRFPEYSPHLHPVGIPSTAFSGAAGVFFLKIWG
jgi:hypothetical protein